MKTIKPLQMQRFSCFCFIDGAQDKTRTCTAERPLPPQSSVYTNFTTWAFFNGANIEHFLVIAKQISGILTRISRNKQKRMHLVLTVFSSN